MSWRPSVDGKLVHPRKGKIDPLPEGYHTEHDPYTALPILPECSHRTKMRKKLRCCTRTVTYCKHFDKQVSNLECLGCGGK